MMPNATRMQRTPYESSHESGQENPKSPQPSAGTCYLCGKPAVWSIALAGEDEKSTEVDACEAHAHGHLRISYLASS